MRSATLIGLLGGSFDPFHNGHLALAKAAVGAFSFDKLLLMPEIGRASCRERV